jgi:ribosomal protein S18 acetylase RimI-like enzyme
MRSEDVDAIALLSLRSWESVFQSLRETMGERLFSYFYGPDWREYQERDVRRACDAYRVLVAERDGQLVGFTAIDIKDGEAEGEIYMLAVDPSAQQSGIGTRLTEAAVDVIRDAGCSLAIVGTGADRGHATARATYRKVGFIPVPGEQLYLLLGRPPDTAPDSSS